MKIVVVCVIVGLLVSTVVLPAMARSWLDRLIDWLEAKVSEYQLGPAIGVLLNAPLMTLGGSGIGGGTPRVPLVGPGEVFTAD